MLEDAEQDEIEFLLGAIGLQSSLGWPWSAIKKTEETLKAEVLNIKGELQSDFRQLRSDLNADLDERVEKIKKEVEEKTKLNSYIWKRNKWRIKYVERRVFLST